jgi:hypothetical protein
MMKRIGMILAVALLVGMAWTSTARATPAWFTCEVSVAGMAATNAVSVRLSDLAATPAFTNTWFLGSSLIAKEMLAVALTAIAIDSPVSCRVDLAFTPPQLIRLYLKK